MTLPLFESYREISLTQGQVAFVDEKDYERVSQHRWCAHWAPNIKGFYATRNDYSDGKHSIIKLHRFILGITNPRVKVDHKDHDVLNCCRYNLRACTNIQNCQNQKIRSDNKSGYKGVTWRKDCNKWYVSICFNKKWMYLGIFLDKEEAARTYDRKAIELFGEFAHTNFPRSDYDVELTALTLPDLAPLSSG